MLNYIWTLMVLTGIAYAVITGHVEEVSNGFLSSSKEAVSMCVTMLGVISFWMGIMEIGKKAGIMQQMTRLVDPFVSFMFPHIPREHKSREFITTNIIANILGLGWAATPPGLKAMEALTELEEERQSAEERKSEETNMSERKSAIVKKKTLAVKRVPEEKRKLEKERKLRSDAASDEMCTFLVLNISSLQLIPVNIIAYRSQYGSVNPTAVVAPAIVATAVSTLVGILFCKCMTRR